MDRHIEIEKSTIRTWIQIGETFDFEAQYAAKNLQKKLDTLAKISRNVGRTSRPVDISRQSIKSTAPDSRPIYSAPYRAGPEECEFEKREINKMLRLNVIKPLKSE